MHALLVIFVWVAIVTVAALAFGIWLMVSIIRWIVRLMLGPGLKQTRIAPPACGTAIRHCGRGGCLAPNPVSARFCRRCGQTFAPPQRVPVQRAAVL